MVSGYSSHPTDVCLDDSLPSLQLKYVFSQDESFDGFDLFKCQSTIVNDFLR